jgi:hypothetical protein
MKYNQDTWSSGVGRVWIHCNVFVLCLSHGWLVKLSVWPAGGGYLMYEAGNELNACCKARISATAHD